MGLETGTGIGDLVPTNPLSTDAVSAGDDHIRLIKTVMQSITFLKSIQTFTASGTWTRPANVKKILIYCLGGGAGGGGGVVGSHSGGGGSSGGSALKWLDVSAISTATVTIGGGGTGGAVGAVGANGTNTTFVTSGPVNQCLAQAGIGGVIAHAGGAPAIAGSSIGDIVFPGSAGNFGMPPHATVASYGATGGGSGNPSDANAHANSGGGGGGGYSHPAAAIPGLNGGSGYCIVFEFGW